MVDVKMANIQIALNEVSKTIMKQVVKVIADVAPRHNVSDVDAFTQEMLSALGFGEEVEKPAKKAGKMVLAVAAAAPAEGSVKSEGEKSSGRKRVVSKKMKEAFMALEGATEAKLKEAMTAYKEAAEVDSFDALARQMLGLAVEVVAEKPKKEKKPKGEKKPAKEKSGRFSPNTTSRKLFKTIVEESGGDWKTVLECNLVKFIEDLTEEQFASASIQGHMRAYVATLVAAAAPVEEKEEVVAAGGGGWGGAAGGSARDAKADTEEEEDEDDEDMEEFKFDGEELLIGVKTGKIYQHTAEAGDVLVGVAGKGRFKKVSKPKA